MRRLLRKLLGMRPMLATFATLTTLGVAGMVTLGITPLDDGRHPAFPQAVCAGKPDGSVTIEHPAEAVTLRFRARGCHAAATESRSLRLLFDAERAALDAVGLPRTPSAPVIDVRDVEEPAVLPVQGSGGGAVFPLKLPADRRRALARQVLAELAVAAVAPKLSAQDRGRAAGAFAAFAGGTMELLDQQHAGVRSATPSALGVFDAWVASQLGEGTLARVLNRCKRACAWAAEIAKELRAAGADPRAVASRFARQAGDREQEIIRLLVG
jgi:hypothetical protein